MAIDPEKKKKRIKVKVKPGQDAPEIPSGFERSPERSKPGKDVYIRKTEQFKTTPVDEGQGREATAKEKSAMVAGTFYGPNEAQYREPKTSVSTSKEEMIVKKKEPKYKEEAPPKVTAAERRASRQGSREMRGKKQAGGSCPTGRGRISRARY